MTTYTPSIVEAEVDKLRKEAYLLNEKIILDCHVFSNRPRMDLMLLFLPKDFRQQGYGKMLMLKLITIADAHNCPIVLSPEGCFGTPPAVLEKFYTELGFQWQTEQEMVRVPRK